MSPRAISAKNGRSVARPRSARASSRRARARPSARAGRGAASWISVGEVEEARRTGRSRSSSTRGRSWSASSIARRDRRARPRARTTSPKRRRRSSSSTASSRSSASSETSKSASRVTRKTALLDDLHLREEPRQEVRDRRPRAGRTGRAARLRGSAAAPPAPSRARSAPRPSPGRATKTPRLSERPGDVGERLARARRRAASAPGRSRASKRRSQLLELLLVAVVDARDDDALLGERGLQVARPELATARAVSSSTRSRISASVCSGVRPSGERTARPGVRLVHAGRRRAP